MSPARPTIGLFITSLNQPWTIPQWKGVCEGARRRNANLVCFCGGLLLARNGNESQANILYDLAGRDRLDGIVLWTAGLDSFLSPEELADFASRYRDMPVVSVENPIAGLHNVVMDNYHAMRRLVAHQVEDHGCRNLAFVQNISRHHAGIQERFRAYVDSMASYGIPFDPRLVSPPFNFETLQNDPKLAEWILLVRSLGKASIFGFNDVAAIGTLEVIRSLGLRVPQDLALIGFDDLAEARSVTPPLTTASPPFYELGLEAVSTLLDLIEGKAVEETTCLDTPVVIRRSCGCQDPSVIRAGGFAAVGASNAPDAAWSDSLWDEFIDESRGGSEGGFLRCLEEKLFEAIVVDSAVLGWQEAVSTMRLRSLSLLPPERRDWAEGVWQQARVMIGAAARRQEAGRGLKTSKRLDQIRQIQDALISTFNIDGLMTVLAESLPLIGVPGCYLSLYDHPVPYRYPQPAPATSRLILAFDALGRAGLEAGGQTFPSRQLVPEGIWPTGGPYSFVAEPLFFQTDQLGFVLFLVQAEEGMIYETLRGLVSTALEGALLMTREQVRANQLQAAAVVSRASSSILELEDLIHRVVSLLSTHFALASAELYLVEERRGRGVLRAGAGARSKTAEGLVEACIVEAERRAAAGEAADASALLSEDRTEIALPLVSKARVVGALSVRRSPRAPFGVDEVDVLQTMSDQIANAIENSRLHAEEKQRSMELGEAYRALKENQERSLIMEKMASLGRLTAGIAHEMNTPLGALRASLAELGRLAEEYASSIGDAAVTAADHGEIAAEMRASIRLADSAAERAAGFVRGIKNQTRDIGRAESISFDAIPIIDEALLLLGHALAAGKCSLNFAHPAQPLFLSGSPGRLAQVVTNLVRNAIDAQVDEREGAISLSLSSLADCVELRVGDGGCGIAPENLSRIFDPLFTTKPIGQGTGLGLTIVHDIVVGEFGGTIDVASALGKGTTFTLRFPPEARGPALLELGLP